jgi:hypothetical protein
MDIYKLLEIILPSLISCVFGFAMAIFLYRNRNTRHLKIVTKLFSIESEKYRELIKSHQSITKLELVDEKGKHINPYPLKDGQTVFRCVATYLDGSKGDYSPFWLCWSKDGGRGTYVFGNQRKAEVSVNCAPRHEKYTELSCWVYMPSSVDDNSHIPHDSIGFKYEEKL